jgi:hypothetical protein
MGQSTSQHRHFSPEDGDSMLLRNVGICLHIHIASKPEKDIVVSSFRLRTYLYTLITTNFISLVLPPLLRKFVFNF